MSIEEDLTELLPLRGLIDVPMPSTKEASLMIKKLLYPFSQGMLNVDKKQIRNGLSICKDYLFEDSGNLPTRVLICAECVENAYAKNLLKFAQESLDREDPIGFSFYYDVVAGLETVISALRIGETLKSGGEDIYVAEEVTRFENYFGSPDSLVQSTEGFLHLKKDVTRFASLLRRDSSGFLLLDDILANIRNDVIGPNLAFPVIPDFFIEGVKLTQQVYKVVYPISEGLDT